MQPQLYFNYTTEGDCDVFDLINDAALEVNPCFDIYEIVEQCPFLSDVLGFPTEITYNVYSTTYFNRSDVKTAMHAPQDVSWQECSAEPVFVGHGGPQGEGDTAPDPIQHVLPQVIEATNRVLVGNGDFDMIIITNGTLLAIQNMTWNGQLGFSEQPSTPINITITDLMYASVFNDSDNGAYYAGLDGPQGIMGIQHFERGLMWVETFQSGHMQPEFQPRAAYRHLEWLLGRIDTI
jgi:carboxypeptidase D